MPSSSFQGNWEERLRFFREEKIPHKLWTSKQCRQLAPAISETCGEVVWVGEGQVNNREMHDALLVASRKLGIEIFENNVTGFLYDSSTIEAVVTEKREVRGQKFILASGSWSSQLGDILKIAI